jgi:shikimate dehydrogenase
MPRLAVLGHPVSHSRSPAMHSAALRALGMDRDWSYEAIDISPDGLAERLREMAAADFAGANVTVPHKQAALALASVPSEVAREIGAANTLVFANSEVHAHNTDADGFLASLPQPAAGQRALLLGAGGAARAVLWALQREGARVDLWNRTAARAEQICAELGGTPVAAPDQGDYDLIVNTSAAGLRGEDPFEALPLVADRFSPNQTVVDLVYGEEPTALVAAAVAAGATAVDGLEVLVHQGALSFRIWTGSEPPIDVMRAAARA